MEAEEDNQDFRLFDSAVNPFESLVFFLYPQAVGQISRNVIYQFVIGQRIPWLSRKSVGIKLEVEGKTSFVLWQKNISKQ